MTLVLDQEQAWVQAAQQDLDAFAQLYRLYLPRVYRYIFFRVADRPTAEDLTATVFEKALTGLRTYDPNRGSFAAWLFAIARRVLSDEYHRAQREGELVRLGPAHEALAGGTTPEGDFLRRERRRRLDAYIARLPEREQELLALKFGSGFTNRQIAAITGLSETNVGTIVYRAVRKIKRQFEEEDQS